MAKRFNFGALMTLIENDDRYLMVEVSVASNERPNYQLTREDAKEVLEALVNESEEDAGVLDPDSWLLPMARFRLAWMRELEEIGIDATR